MRLFGLFGKEKAVPFPEFRDRVRLAVRRNTPGCKVDNTENGFTLTVEGKPTSCNLRGLYAAYCKAPQDCDALIQTWLSALVMEIPEHSWPEAIPTLRPTLKDVHYIQHGQRHVEKLQDNLPFAPFAGELSILVVRDLPGTAVPVTQKQLDKWSVTFEAAVAEALNNMNMLRIPEAKNALLAGGSVNRRGQATGEEVGLVFEGDHLTATWAVIGRFRDYLAQRLQGDYVLSLPNRNRLTAIRADEPGLIASVQQSNRSYANLPYALTGQCFHISAAQTGGVVTVYQGGASGDSSAASRLSPSHAPAGRATSASASLPQPAPYTKPQPVDLSTYGDLSEPTGDAPPSIKSSTSNATNKGRV